MMAAGTDGTLAGYEPGSAGRRDEKPAHLPPTKVRRGGSVRRTIKVSDGKPPRAAKDEAGRKA
jgi:hypothetical protein